MTQRWFLWAGVLLGAAVGGCVDDSGRPSTDAFERPPDPGSGVFDCLADADVQLDVMDDFETGAARINWYANNEICEICQALETERDDRMMNDSEDDVSALQRTIQRCRETCSQSQFPTLFDKPLPARRIPGGRCGSQYALHLTTVPLMDWGANLGFVVAEPLDVADAEGIAFWARRSPHSRGVVRVQVSERHTDSRGLPPDAPMCKETSETTVLEEGCDGFGTFVSLSTRWEFHRLPFSRMRQAGWGAPAPYLDTGSILSLTFLFPAGTWDIWIDQVSLYRKRVQP